MWLLLTIALLLTASTQIQVSSIFTGPYHSDISMNSQIPIYYVGPLKGG